MTGLLNSVSLYAGNRDGCAMIAARKWNSNANFTAIENYARLDRRWTEKEQLFVQANLCRLFLPAIPKMSHQIDVLERWAKSEISKNEAMGLIREFEYEAPLLAIRFRERDFFSQIDQQQIHHFHRVYWEFSNSNLLPRIDFAKYACSTLREIFPMSHVDWHDLWRNEEILGLARTIDQQKDYSLIPILGDALADAGCDDPQVLEHVRKPAEEHHSGCWVIESILRPPQIPLTRTRQSGK